MFLKIFQMKTTLFEENKLSKHLKAANLIIK